MERQCVSPSKCEQLKPMADNGILEFLGSSHGDAIHGHVMGTSNVLWVWKCRRQPLEIYRESIFIFITSQPSPLVSTGCDTKKSVKQTARIQSKMESPTATPTLSAWQKPCPKWKHQHECYPNRQKTSPIFLLMLQFCQLF